MKKKAKPPASVDDLVSIIFDLELVRRICSLIVERDRAPSKSEEDGVILLALWTAAVVIYVRCFREGRRYRLPVSMVDALGAQHRETHGHIWSQRDKAVAHMVSPIDTIQAIARYARKDTGGIIHQVNFKRFSHDADAARRLGELAPALARSVNRLLSPLLDKIEMERPPGEAAR